MRRQGYTLMELVLVMAIIVVVASITMPLAESLLNPNRLIAAGDMVRGNLAEMRGRAMSEGRPYRFQIIENSGKFKIEPADGGGNAGWTREDELPEQVVFVKADEVLMGSTTPPNEGSAWETVVVYLPDGSAQDSGELRFGLPGLRPIALRIRELTGAVSILEPGNREEVQP